MTDIHKRKRRAHRELRKLAAEVRQSERELEVAEAELVRIRQEARDAGVPEVMLTIAEAPKVDRDKFYEVAMQPEFSDEMAFQIKSESEVDEVTFSKEAFDAVGDQMRNFVMARTYAQYVKSQHGPKALRVELKCVWDAIPENELEQQPMPWYHLDDVHKLTEVDSMRRLPLDK